MTNRKILERMVNVSGKVVGVKQKSLQELYNDRIMKKGNSIGQDRSHILSQYFDLLPSGRRYRVPCSRTKRMKNTFVPSAIDAMNRKKISVMGRHLAQTLISKF